MVTLLSENTSTTGRPAMVFTENNESDKSSDTSNNLPLFPSMENNVVFAADPEPMILITSVIPSANIAEDVTALVTLRDDKAASEPLTMTFFQFGIMYCYTAVGYLKIKPTSPQKRGQR